MPAGAREVTLCSGLPAFLVSVPAAAHSNKFEQPAQQLKAQRQAAAKAHTQAALEAQQQRGGGGGQQVELGRLGGAAAAVQPKGAAAKKEE